MATSTAAAKPHPLAAAATAITIAIIPFTLSAFFFVAVLADDAEQILLTMYMHHMMGPPGQRSVLILKGSGPMNPSLPPEQFFGETYAFDDKLTDNKSASSRLAGHAQGTAMLSSMRRPVYLVDMVMLLVGGEYDGSTVVVEGLHDASKEERELAVVGGTGEFRLASGYVRCTTAREEKKFNVYELFVNITIPGDDSEPDDEPEPPPGMPPAPEKMIPIYNLTLAN